jgi:hypothetical protein
LNNFFHIIINKKRLICLINILQSDIHRYISAYISACIHKAAGKKKFSDLFIDLFFVS